MSQKSPVFCHVHLVSDATGETLIAVCRAVAAQFQHVRVLEHIHPLIRSKSQIERVINAIDRAPGLVLYTLVDGVMTQALKNACADLAVPCQSILDPVTQLFGSYLGQEANPRIAGQHSLDAEYFKRIDALNFTMAHDDGQMSDDLASADVVLVGVSRTSKTPTSIYLANRGIRTANIPLVPHIPPPEALFQIARLPKRPLIVGLIASPERISQVRQNRMQGLGVNQDVIYVDRRSIAREVNDARTLFTKFNWPFLDVTRRSIEETAAGILAFLQDRKNEEEL